MINKILIIRMLGNDIPGLHGENQTLSNLKFTLENEVLFENTDKMYVLNRIIDNNIKNEIINLLNTYKTKYLDLPFDRKKFDDIPKLNLSTDEYINLPYHKKIHTMKDYNLFLVNNNKCRNYCIHYGKNKGYEWIFVLDSNNFFTKKDFYNIFNNLDDEIDYIIIPQKRLKDGNLNNNSLLTLKNSYFENLPNQEPQIAFKNVSSHTFNEKIPYGLMPKAELLNAFNVKGKWNDWRFEDFGWNDIKQRKFYNVKFKILSKIIRLNPMNTYNNVNMNPILRYDGLFKLKNMILENKYGGKLKIKNGRLSSKRKKNKKKKGSQKNRKSFIK